MEDSRYRAMEDRADTADRLALAEVSGPEGTADFQGMGLEVTAATPNLLWAVRSGEANSVMEASRHTFPSTSASHILLTGG